VNCSQDHIVRDGSLVQMWLGAAGSSSSCPRSVADTTERRCATRQTCYRDESAYCTYRCVSPSLSTTPPAIPRSEEAISNAAGSHRDVRRFVSGRTKTHEHRDPDRSQETLQAVRDSRRSRPHNLYVAGYRLRARRGWFLDIEVLD
jgi:hypothetical protein